MWLTKVSILLHLLQAATGTFDGILNTISAKHAIIPLLGLLKSHGKLVLLGAPPEPLDLHSAPLLMGMQKFIMFPSFLCIAYSSVGMLFFLDWYSILIELY